MDNTAEALLFPRRDLRELSPRAQARAARERLRLIGLLLRYGGRGALAGFVLCQTAFLATAVASVLITGWLVCAALTAHRLAQVAAPVAAFTGSVLVALIAPQVGEMFADVAADRVDGAVRARVRAIALAPDGIAHLDDAEFRDDMERAGDLGISWRVMSPGRAATGLVGVCFTLLSALASAVVIALHFPLLAPILLAAALTVRSMTMRQWLWLSEVQDRRARIGRRSRYWFFLGIRPEASRDLRMFGLARWVADGARARSEQGVFPVLAARVSVLRRQVVPGALIALAAALALDEIATSGQGANVTARCLGATWGVLAVSFFGMEAYDVAFGLITMRALDRVSARHLPAPRAAQAAAPATDPLIEIRGLSFTYPGAAVPVLHGLDLLIRPGEVLAVVGVNGAGKSTLMKLLAGLYRPTSGSITADGVDIADLPARVWRNRMTVLFQDFVRFPATVADNIALSAPESLGDRPGIEAAIDAAGARDLVDALPEGARTLLWKGAAGGADLSGGQWQKIAIARTLFAVAHGRRLLVLDEPTAHLDVEAERDFNRRITDAAGDATVVLISHRLSNVRTADRIAVLDGGRITETGTHEQLMELGGSYAGLFRLQAARFAEAAQS